MKKTALKRYTPLRAKTGLKRTPFKRTSSKGVRTSWGTTEPHRPLRKPDRSKKITNKGYKPPKWFTGIPLGAHGNSPAQKKYWKLVSIAVRVEDHEKYKRCVACQGYIERWQDGQAGHYKAWANCNGFFKYERKNLALICGRCNKISDGPINDAFREEMKRRYGFPIIGWIEQQNERHRGQKMEVWEIVERAEPLYEKYKNLL